MSRRRQVPFEFRLYVAGVTRNSELARANLAILCATLTPGQYAVEVVDVLEEPDRAPGTVDRHRRAVVDVLDLLGGLADKGGAAKKDAKSAKAVKGQKQPAVLTQAGAPQLRMLGIHLLAVSA